MSVAILCSDGTGGSIHGQNCAEIVFKVTGVRPTVFYAARDETFEPIKYLFPDTIQIPEEFQHNNNFERPGYKERFIGEYGQFDEIYYVVPDLLYQNAHAFDYKRYNTTPTQIKQYRALTHLYKPEKKVFLGLTTTTNGYHYEHIREFIIDLAQRLPDYELYFPSIKQWAGVSLDYTEILKDLPSNVTVAENPSFIDSIKVLCNCEYGIFTCNGLSHIAFSTGQNRLVFDPQFNRIPFMSRWKETYEELVPFDTPAKQAAKVVEINLRQPISCLIDRKFLFNIEDKTDFERKVLLKTI